VRKDLRLGALRGDELRRVRGRFLTSRFRKRYGAKPTFVQQVCRDRKTHKRRFSGTLSLPESGRSFIASATQAMVSPLLAATVVC